MKKLAFVLFALGISGCGSYQATTQVADVAYLQFVGETSGMSMQLDSNSPIDLERETESFDLNGRTVTKFNVTPGTHQVQLDRNGKTLVKKKFYVSSGNVYEVVLP